jgi:hypothetical protein
VQLARQEKADIDFITVFALYMVPDGELTDKTQSIYPKLRIRLTCIWLILQLKLPHYPLKTLNTNLPAAHKIIRNMISRAIFISISKFLAFLESVLSTMKVLLTWAGFGWVLDSKWVYIVKIPIYMF